MQTALRAQQRTAMSSREFAARRPSMIQAGPGSQQRHWPSAGGRSTGAHRLEQAAVAAGSGVPIWQWAATLHSGGGKGPGGSSSPQVWHQSQGALPVAAVIGLTRHTHPMAQVQRARVRISDSHPVKDYKVCRAAAAPAHHNSPPAAAELPVPAIGRTAQGPLLRTGRARRSAHCPHLRWNLPTALAGAGPAAARGAPKRRRRTSQRAQRAQLFENAGGRREQLLGAPLGRRRLQHRDVHLDRRLRWRGGILRRHGAVCRCLAAAASGKHAARCTVDRPQGPSPAGAHAPARPASCRCACMPPPSCAAAARLAHARRGALLDLHDAAAHDELRARGRGLPEADQDGRGQRERRRGQAGAVHEADSRGPVAWRGPGGGAGRGGGGRGGAAGLCARVCSQASDRECVGGARGGALPCCLAARLRMWPKLRMGRRPRGRAARLRGAAQLVGGRCRLGGAGRAAHRGSP